MTTTPTTEPCVKVVAVDDDPNILAMVRRALEREGMEVSTHSAPLALFDALEGDDRDAAVVLTDLHMPEIDGLGVLEHVKATLPGVPVVFLTGEATISSAVDAIRQGAYDYLVKPLDPISRLATTILRALDYRRLLERNRFLEGKVALSDRFEAMVGESEAIREVFSLVESVADADLSVLIYGESGTGKELVARAIHERSARASRPFVAVNCGALSESVLESELFGHVKGAFTGAHTARLGLFEEASGSTLLLDEVGELPLSTQVKLLRTLQEGEVRPVGANDTRKVDVRIVAATHRKLSDAVADGSFREDLYYRLNVMEIAVPPLRARSEDLPALVQHLISKHSERLKRTVDGVDSEALDIMGAYPWPGNVRELENVIMRALALARGGRLTASLLPAHVRSPHADVESPRGDIADMPLAEARDAFEVAYLERALTRSEGNVATAARTSGLDPSNLRRLLKRHEVDAKSFKS